MYATENNTTIFDSYLTKNTLVMESIIYYIYSNTKNNYQNI